MEDTQTYEQGDCYPREIVTPLQQFFAGGFKTDRCEVKLSQEWR